MQNWIVVMRLLDVKKTIWIQEKRSIKISSLSIVLKVLFDFTRNKTMSICLINLSKQRSAEVQRAVVTVGNSGQLIDNA